MSMNKVVIILSTCQHVNKVFGIRFEEFDRGNWVGTWAFPIKESVAQREGYDKVQITGSFSFANSYPGCPYCKAVSIFKCSCGKNVCWDGETKNVKCPICKQSVYLSGLVTDMMAGTDG